MATTIDYYFSTVSPWAFMGHAPFMEVARRHGASVDYRPVALGDLFSETGGLPLGKRHPARQRYRLVEMQRWRQARNIELNLKPAHWPFNAAFTDRLILAALREGHDAGALFARIASGVWQREEDLGNPEQVAAVLDELGLGRDLMAAADAPEIIAAYKANEEAAIAADVFGSPSYVLNGEVFWGQDRIELLDAALSSGRAPFKP